MPWEKTESLLEAIFYASVWEGQELVDRQSSRLHTLGYAATEGKVKACTVLVHAVSKQELPWKIKMVISLPLKVVAISVFAINLVCTYPNCAIQYYFHFYILFNIISPYIPPCRTCVVL